MNPRIGALFALSLTLCLGTMHGIPPDLDKSTVAGKVQTDALEETFHQPPAEAAPWVYWVWLSTPTTPAAITRDLEEMKAKGIGGFILYANGAGTVYSDPAKMVVDDRQFKKVPTNEYQGQYSTKLPFLADWSPAWRKEIRFVASESKRLGLAFCLTHGLAGCSAPGLDLSHGQQKLEWTSTKASGPADFNGVLPLAAGNKYPEKTLNIAFLAVPDQKVIQLADVQDLSQNVDSSGRLKWHLPPGKWKLLRIYQRPTGARNVWGPYCDTLTPEGIEQAWALTMAPLLKEMTPEERSGLIGVEDDSWESGIATWTRTFPAEFQHRRNYNLLPYLPALTGIQMVDATTTARILQDYRQTISDLIVDNYYAHMCSICHQNGLSLYDEANGPNYNFADFSRTASKVDFAMAEFWMPSAHRPLPANRFLAREAATSNHLYGKKLTMCEAFTTLGPMWEETPFSMKACVDQAYCDGTTRPCIHNYSHSPLLDAKPGDVYCAGTHINRNITWWEEFPAFQAYLARCDAMLMAGNFVADALFDTGDGINRAQPTKIINPGLGAGYDYDRASNVAIAETISVKQGCLVTSGGMSYRILILPEQQDMTLPALKKLDDLAEAGATIVGPPPTGLYGLPGNPDEEKQFADLKTHLWGNGGQSADHPVGQGRVITNKTPEAVLRSEGIGPDFEYEGLSSHGEIGWIHRHTTGEDWYFVASRWFSPEDLKCKFRITGKKPELWDPVTGEIREAKSFLVENGQTTIPLHFDPCGSLFVVFRQGLEEKPASMDSSNFPTLQPLATLEGPWTVQFDPKWGGPESPVIFDTLVDWTSRPESGIKYFSGTAVYTKTFDLPASVNSRKHLVLDLGELHEVATVKLNGKNLGVSWMHPARVDISSAVQSTGNRLEIKVVNLWPNRLIGDSFLPLDQQLTQTNMHHFTKSSSLLPSGLLGPVQILGY